MSTWNLGINDVSEETQAFKDKLSSKDSQIAAQQTQLMRKAAELEELQSTLNDALHKLSHETNRVLQLERDLDNRNNDLRNEKITTQNIGQALATAQERIKTNELETRDLEAHLQTLSHTSDGHSSRSAKLEREKSMLEARVRELQGNLQQLSCPPITPGRSRTARPRSSSVSNFRITTLEQELNDVRDTVSQKTIDLTSTNEKLTQVQKELIRVGNERLAIEKRMNKQVAELQATLEEKEYELGYIKQQAGDGSREEELMKRIEEDEAKIIALEKLLRSGQDARVLEDKLRWTEQRLTEQEKRLSEGEERHIELVREKEEVLDELEHARLEISRLSQSLTERENYISTQPNETQQANIKPEARDTMDVTGDDSLPAPILHSQPSEIDAATVERLLNAIERLRGERDTLQRNMSFLEYESKFKIEALETQLASSSSTIAKITASSNEAIQGLQAEIDALNIQLTGRTSYVAATIQERVQEIRRLNIAVMASATVIQHLHSEGSLLERQLFNTCASRAEIEDCLTGTRAENDELIERLKECETKLVVTVSCLETATSQRDDLMLQLDAKDEERESDVSKLRTTVQELQDSLEETHMQLVDVSKSIQDVESERDSLVLQVTNLTTELQTVQDDLTNAESRYSSLQFHQLSSMSSNEAIRALRDQIQELEMRVLRRTEQIGIHQHDIKRLETNLQLSEDHIEELTTELEMATAQKNAMVEDCADAREARDEAFARLEEMEAFAEVKNDEGDATVAALVGVILQTVGTSRLSARRLNDTAYLTQEKLYRLEASHQDALFKLEKIPELEHQLSLSKEAASQLTLALAASQVQQSHTSSSLDRLQDTHNNLLQEVQKRQVDFDKLCLESASLEKELEVLRHEASVKASDFTSMKSELEDHICSLQASIASMEAAHQKAAAEQEVSSNHRAAIDSVLKDQIQALKANHTEELVEMRTRLDETSDLLEALRKRHELAEADHERKISDIIQSKQGLEIRLSEVTEQLIQSSQEKNESAQTQKETENEILCLKRDLGVALADVQQAQQVRDEVQEMYQQTLDALTQLRLDHDTQVSRSTEQSSIQKQLEKELADLQSKYDSQSLRLEQTILEVNHLSSNLQSEISGRSQDQEAHEKRLLLTNQRLNGAESSLATVSQELEGIKGQLKQSEQNLAMLQEEKLSLQENITSLEAEVQRSISFSRFLESQVKESEGKAASISAELERTQADLARSEKAAKAAEVNLSLQGAQHKRETADVQRELAALRSQPNLQVALAELEERNNEMEELLRAKCTEIEENDDRALEMLKDNKKLTTKVESLNRKVQNLQTKLAAAKASIPNPPPNAMEARPSPATSSGPSSTYSMSRPRPDVPTDAPPLPPIPPIPAYALPSATRTPLHRTVSGPSSLARPKTPEPKVAPPPVFKAKTPERRAVSMVSPDGMSSASTIGKKRRAPDDFEACESVPPQGFTADSLPSNEIEHITPRVRRVLTNIQSGFTPVRNNNPRPVLPIPSPKRPSMSTSTKSSPMIADVTNSPRQSAKSSKRSWLGKIRGVSTQTTGRTADVRPRFERMGDAQ